MCKFSKIQKRDLSFVVFYIFFFQNNGLSRNQSIIFRQSRLFGGCFHPLAKMHGSKSLLVLKDGSPAPMGGGGGRRRCPTPRGETVGWRGRFWRWTKSWILLIHRPKWRGAAGRGWSLLHRLKPRFSGEGVGGPSNIGAGREHAAFFSLNHYSLK